MQISDVSDIALADVPDSLAINSLERIRQRLVDTSARNRLINCRLDSTQLFALWTNSPIRCTRALPTANPSHWIQYPHPHSRNCWTKAKSATTRSPENYSRSANHVLKFGRVGMASTAKDCVPTNSVCVMMACSTTSAWRLRLFQDFELKLTPVTDEILPET